MAKFLKEEELRVLIDYINNSLDHKMDKGSLELPDNIVSLDQLIAYAASRIVNNNFLSIISGVVLSVPVYLFLLWRMHNPVVDMAIKMIRDRKNKVVQ